MATEISCQIFKKIWGNFELCFFLEKFNGKTIKILKIQKIWGKVIVKCILYGHHDFFFKILNITIKS